MLASLRFHAFGEWLCCAFQTSKAVLQLHPDPSGPYALSCTQSVVLGESQMVVP